MKRHSHSKPTGFCLWRFVKGCQRIYQLSRLCPFLFLKAEDVLKADVFLKTEVFLKTGDFLKASRL